MNARPLDKQELAVEAPPLGDASGEWIAPWEEIEAGRFMPRRIRGSFRGQALG